MRRWTTGPLDHAPLSRAPAASPQPAPDTGIAIQGKQLLVDGRPFQVRGIHYGPWRPGTGPNKDYPYPSEELIEEDLQLIQAANANAIVVYNAPGYMLDLAHQYDLKVIYTFSLNWWGIGSDSEADAQRRQEVLDQVKKLRGKPALLMWVLGNEIPTSAVHQRGEDTIVEGLRDLYEAVREIDPARPITHSNWPPVRFLDLGFFDIASFNVYPLWPPELVARGFGDYLREELQAVAGDRPMLITEFGINTIEASEQRQAEVIQECWLEITQSGTMGGVVFAFADEWWKNYDRPVRPGDWWTREPDLDAELQHDLDPEEHYGIMTAQREPKPAYFAVQQMFAPEQPDRIRAIAGAAVALLVGFAGWGWWRARRRPHVTQASDSAAAQVPQRTS